MTSTKAVSGVGFAGRLRAGLAASWRRFVSFGHGQPYWQRRLEDEQAGRAALRIGEHIARNALAFLLLCVFVLLPALYLSAIVFIVPGGPAAIIGRHLADICLTSGRCDLGYLMAGYAWAVTVAISVAVYIAKSILDWAGPEDDTSTARDLAFIDERLTTLRADLVKAGLLEPEPGEDDYTEGEPPFCASCGRNLAPGWALPNCRECTEAQTLLDLANTASKAAALLDELQLTQANLLAALEARK